MRRSPPLFSFAALVLTIAACSTRPAPAQHNEIAPAPEPTQSNADQSVVGSNPAELRVTSIPAAGSTVTGPVNQLVLDFDQPVALAEVLVKGPDGLMPMMIGSAGAQKHFEIPVPGLLAGSYEVSWRASLNGIAKRGNFAFTVK